MTQLEYFKQWAAHECPTLRQDGVENNGRFVFDSYRLQQMWKAFQYGGDVRPTTTMENGQLNKEELRRDNPETLVNRLRGIYPVPGVPGQYKTAPIQHEAARRIEELEAELRELEADFKETNNRDE